MALHAFRSRDDVFLQKGKTYVLDTVSGEIQGAVSLPLQVLPAATASPPVVAAPAPAVAVLAATPRPETASEKKFIRRSPAERLRALNALLLSVWERPGLRSNDHSGLREYESYKAIGVAVIGDLHNLEKSGFVKSRREATRPGRGAPSGVIVYWDMTDAGIAEARKIRALGAEAAERQPADQATPPFLRVLA